MVFIMSKFIEAVDLFIGGWS